MEQEKPDVFVCKIGNLKPNEQCVFAIANVCLVQRGCMFLQVHCSHQLHFGAAAERGLRAVPSADCCHAALCGA